MSSFAERIAQFGSEFKARPKMVRPDYTTDEERKAAKEKYLRDLAAKQPSPIYGSSKHKGD